MRKRIRVSVVASALMFAGAFVAPAVLAQSTQSTAPQAAAPTAPAFNPKDAGPPPSDTELGHFVDAAFQVQAIGNQARPEFEAAKTDADRAKVRQDAESKMASAVQQNKLTVKRYKQIFVAMQTNKDVRNKVQALVKKKHGE